MSASKCRETGELRAMQREPSRADCCLLSRPLLGLPPLSARPIERVPLERLLLICWLRAHVMSDSGSDATVGGREGRTDARGRTKRLEGEREGERTAYWQFPPLSIFSFLLHCTVLSLSPPPSHRPAPPPPTHCRAPAQLEYRKMPFIGREGGRRCTRAQPRTLMRPTGFPKMRVDAPFMFLRRLCEERELPIGIGSWGSLWVVCTASMRSACATPTFY